MRKHKNLVLIVYFAFLLTACEKRPDLNPLVAQLENQIEDFDAIAQEILAHPGISSIYSETNKKPSFSYQNNQPPDESYSFPITLEALSKIGSPSVHVKYTDSAETPTITRIGVSKVSVIPIFTLKPVRGIFSGWTYLTASPDPKLIMSSSICHENLLDKYVDVNQFPDQNVSIEIYLPTKIPNWYIYCSIDQPNPN